MGLYQLIVIVIIFLFDVQAQELPMTNDHATHSAPIIDLFEDEIELNYGVTWNVTCKFTKPIVWKSYDPWFDWAPPNITSTAIYTEGVEYPHVAYLTIRNASAAVVGRYYCVPSEHQDDDLEEMVTEEKVSSIYVFVKDYTQPLVPTPSVYYAQKGFIPCKPSYPDVEVELCNRFRECLTGYNSTKGFAVSKSSALLSEDGILFCKCDIANYTIQVIMKNDLPQPIITSTSDNFVLEGQLVRLNCSIIALPSQAVELTWTFSPYSQPAVSNQSVKIEKLETTPHPELNHRIVFSRVLIIESATVKHSKTYRCEVSDGKKLINYNSYKLMVHATSGNFAILAGMDNMGVINRKRNSNGELKPIDIFVYNITNSWEKLTISDPAVNDTGVYTTVVKSGEGNDHFDAYVHVHEKPSVYMESKHANMAGEEAEFICNAVGYPLPEIRLEYQQCVNVPWQNCSYAEDNPIDRNMSESSPNTTAVIKNPAVITKGIKKITAEYPGLVYCTATNSEGNETVQAYLLMRSMTTEIQLERMPAEGLITVGDNATFICSVIDVDSANIPTNLRFLHNSQELSQSDGMHQSYFYESIFLKSQLIITNVRLDMTGHMKCRIKSKDAYSTSKAIQFEVVEPIAPQLLSSKKNEIVKINVSESLVLRCNVTGTPRPEVTWFKDAIPLQTSNTSQYANESMFSIHSLEQHDYGLYECRAKNKAGNITQSWNVEKASSETEQSRETSINILVSIIIAVFIIVVILIVYIVYRRWNRIKNSCISVKYHQPATNTNSN